jgi:predicted nucleic acid-binding protein
VLRKFQRGEFEGIVLDFAVDTIVIVMENYGKRWSTIRKFLSSLLGYKGLHIYFSSLLDRITATDHMKKFGLDFDDAMTYQAMMANEISNIISYDGDFDVVPKIRRVLPESVSKTS